MINSKAMIASANLGVTIAIAFAGVITVMFLFSLICIWWVDKKKKPLKDLFKAIGKPFAKIFGVFTYDSSVKTVYSDKSMNYSGTEFLPIPTKAPTDQYTYEFVGWDKNGVDERGNIVVRAIYLQKVVKCFINVYDDDKTTLLGTFEADYGSGVNLSDLKPTKADSKEFSYKFVGWDKDTSAFYKNENVYAVYQALPKKFEYKFILDDGTVVSEGVAIYGTPIYAPSAPAKTADDQMFEFAGWKNYKEGMVLTRNQVFVAEYKGKHVQAHENEPEEIFEAVEEKKVYASRDEGFVEVKKPSAVGVRLVENSSALEEDFNASGTLKVRKVRSKKSAKVQQKASEKRDSNKKVTAGGMVVTLTPKKDESNDASNYFSNMLVNKIKIKKDDN